MEIATGPWLDGRLAYAIGDVHGRDDLLQALLERIAQDAALRRAQFAGPPLLVMLGDYIDRGRQSREVLDRLVQLRASDSFEVRLLLGNHEEAMLDFAEGRTSGRGWVKFGGKATLESYGVEVPPTFATDDDCIEPIRFAFMRALPKDHLALLRSLELFVRCGDVVFVHAGLRPGVAFDAQTRADMLGIRGEFLRQEGGFGHFIVHGHSPVERCEIKPHRLNLDTGAYMSGLLSAARLNGGPPVIL